MFGWEELVDMLVCGMGFIKGFVFFMLFLELIVVIRKRREILEVFGVFCIFCFNGVFAEVED